MLHMENPAPGKVQGSKIVIRFPAADSLDPTKTHTIAQADIAPLWLVGRFALPIATARAVALANGFGGAQ